MEVYIPYTCTEYIYTYIIDQQTHTDKMCFIIYVTIILVTYKKNTFYQCALVGLLPKCEDQNESQNMPFIWGPHASFHSLLAQ